MSFYNNEPQAWQAPARQSSWEEPPPPSRSGTSSTSQQREDAFAFGQQYEEVDRAMDNLMKSGKFYGGNSRREWVPMSMGQRPYSEYGGQSSPRGSSGYNSDLSTDPRMHNPRHSVGDFDSARSHSASGLQNFYASQRYSGRQNEGEQMMQAKRRMAAQRERELRNYHQEQQYNRSLLAEMSSNKSDRSMSPSAMSEEGRRELIARQHRALYGNEASPNMEGNFGGESARPDTQGSNVPTSSAGNMRGPSPRPLDGFGMQGQGMSGENASQAGSSSAQQQDARADSTASPASGNAPAGFGAFDQVTQQSSHTSTSSPGGESPNRQATKAATAPIGSAMGPIGSRPTQQQAPNPALNKRSTTPLPSPLSYGFASSQTSGVDERSTSASSNPPNAPKEPNVGLGWGNSSGVWGNKNSLQGVWG